MVTNDSKEIEQDPVDVGDLDLTKIDGSIKEMPTDLFFDLLIENYSAGWKNLRNNSIKAQLGRIAELHLQKARVDYVSNALKEGYIQQV